MKALRLVPLLLLLAAAGLRAQDPVLPEWQPDLELVIGQLERIGDSAQDQKQLNETAVSLYVLHDAKLYTIFHAWIDMLTGDERVQQLGEQRRWLKRRDDLIDSVSAAHAGTSAAPMATYGEAAALTRERIAELEARLAAGLEKWRADRKRR